MANKKADPEEEQDGLLQTLFTVGAAAAGILAVAKMLQPNDPNRFRKMSDAKLRDVVAAPDILSRPDKWEEQRAALDEMQRRAIRKQPMGSHVPGDCSACGATGKQGVCSRCHGVGMVDHWRPNPWQDESNPHALYARERAKEQPCIECQGSGAKTCTYCKGTGAFPPRPNR